MTTDRSTRRVHGFRDTGLRDDNYVIGCGDVPNHTDLPRDLEGAHRAVQFIRRSPDPTIQLVRAAVLRAVRGADDGGTRVIDPSALSLEQLMAISSPLSLADRIAEANLAMLQREGPDRIGALLASLRAPDA